jgi:hypothetical protein
MSKMALLPARWDDLAELLSPRKVADRAPTAEMLVIPQDRLCVVTTWSDPPISWPRCQPMGQRGGHGLLFEGQLIQAVRTESALAICFWWGVSEGVVWRWRKVLGIPRAGTTCSLTSPPGPNRRFFDRTLLPGTRVGYLSQVTKAIA